MEAKAIYLEQKPWLQFYPEGVPESFEISNSSIPQAFDNVVNKYRKNTALIFYGRKMSYQELKEQADRFATALYDLGLRKGDRIAFLLLNSPQFIIALLGALRIGVVVTPISPVYVSSEVKHQLLDSGADTIFCLDILYETIEKTGIEPKRVILTNIGEFLPPLKKAMGKSVLRAVYRKMELPSPKIYERENFYKFQDLLGNYPPTPPKIDIDPEEDIAVLPYTGGTTGLPKGAMLTHRNLIASAEIYKLWWSPVIREGQEVMLGHLPFYHVAALWAITLTLLLGNTTLIFTTPDPDEILSSMESYKATMMLANPTLYAMFKDHEKTGRVRWSRMKVVASAADALHESVARDFEKRAKVKLVEAFGMTEDAALSHCVPPGRPKYSYFGIPLPNVRVAIVDPDTNEYVPIGEKGELLVWSPAVMKGYWNNPEATEEAIVELDGQKWLRTGDIVSMDEEGYFQFYERKRDLIKYKGYSIYAREIEEALTSNPKIREAGVIGVPNPEVGEIIKAVVVLETEARGKMSEQEVINWCEQKLAHYKVPRIVEFRGEIPKTDIGKISHRELRESIFEEKLGRKI